MHKTIITILALSALCFLVGCASSETSQGNASSSGSSNVGVATSDASEPEANWTLKDNGDFKPTITDSTQDSVTIEFTGGVYDSYDQLLGSMMTVDGTSYSISDGADGFAGFPLTITQDGKEVDAYWLASIGLSGGESTSITIAGDFKEFTMDYDEVLMSSSNNRFDFKGLKLVVTRE